MPSTTPLTDSLMRRADSMLPNAVVVGAPFARGLESDMRRIKKAAETLLDALDEHDNIYTDEKIHRLAHELRQMTQCV